MSQMLEDENIPFMSVEDKEVSFVEYQYISAISHKTNGANIVEGEDISQFYQTIVHCILKGKLADAQSLMHRFSKEISKDRDIITPADVTHYVEHALGVAFRLNAELTETKAENAELKAKVAALEAEKKQPEVAYLGSANTPFVQLIEVLAKPDQKTAIEDCWANDGHAEFGSLAETGQRFENDYSYCNQIKSNPVVFNNYSKMVESVENLALNATGEVSYAGAMQENLLELANVVKQNNVSGIEMLPPVEFLAYRLFLTSQVIESYKQDLMAAHHRFNK